MFKKLFIGIDKPSLTAPLISDEKSELLMQCSVSGNPSASYQWVKNDVVIPNANSQNYTKTTERADAGYYICRVNNVVGTVDSAVHELKVPCMCFCLYFHFPCENVNLIQDIHHIYYVYCIIL